MFCRCSLMHIVVNTLLASLLVLVAAAPAAANSPFIVNKGIIPEIFDEGFESGDTACWGVQPLNLAQALSRTPITLPDDEKNAADYALLVNYLGTGKSLDGAARQQLPFRAYFATCAENTDSPRLFVSLTLDDTSADANPDHPLTGP